jgi:alpha-tubulin suppressor-like RCC1 family protein
MSILQSILMAGGGQGNKLFAWGANSSSSAGALGLGDLIARSSPVQVGVATTWSKVSSHEHTAATRSDGTLWGWGSNFFGEVGNGSSGNNISTPVQIGSLTNWSKIATGANCTFSIKTDGTLWSWGNNGDGQLGQNDLTQRVSPTQIGAATYWTEIGANSLAILAVGNSGRLYSWGYGAYGQLGLSDTLTYSSPTQVGANTNWSKVSQGGLTHAMAITTTGTLWAIGGDNSSGALGLGDTVSRSSPVQVGALTTWSKVVCGYNFTIALKTDGTLWSWGGNSSGALGRGATFSGSSPVQIGALTTWSDVVSQEGSVLALKTDGSLWAWGGNSSGQLGLGDTVNRSSPVQVGTAVYWGAIGGSYASGFAITK